MTLDVLSSIKGAQSSKAVQSIFDTIKSAQDHQFEANFNFEGHSVLSSELREDKAIVSSEKERELIISGFPKQKDGFLVVQKIID